MLKTPLTQLPQAFCRQAFLPQLLGLAVAVMGISGVAIAPSYAQTASNVDPLEDFQTQDGDSDILGGNGQQSLQNLIHRINLLNDLSMEEFTIRGQDNIASEADRFREMQRDRLDSLEVGIPEGSNEIEVTGEANPEI